MDLCLNLVWTKLYRRQAVAYVANLSYPCHSYCPREGQVLILLGTSVVEWVFRMRLKTILNWEILISGFEFLLLGWLPTNAKVYNTLYNPSSSRHHNSTDSFDSLSLSISIGWSFRWHPLSTQLVGVSFLLVCSYVGVYRRMLLMSSSLFF